MPKLKTDKFRSARGGHSRLLQISCAKCGHHVLRYQKDGPGSLKRMYFDRIHAPEELVGLQHHDLKGIPVLSCRGCTRMIAVPYLYREEQRKAFRVFQDAVTKKVIKM